jgi:hypothetical protein
MTGKTAAKPGFKLGSSTMKKKMVEVDEATIPDTGRSSAIANTNLTILESPEQYVREINKLWSEATEKFLAIGRYLVEASEKLEKRGDYKDKVLSKLPFSKNTANQLRTIAYAVDRDRLLSVNELPRSWSNAYKLVRLPQEHIDLARRKGLTTPTATRAEIDEFLESLKPVHELSPEEERQQLLEKIAKREKELKELRERLRQASAIDGEFTAHGDE